MEPLIIRGKRIGASELDQVRDVGLYPLVADFHKRLGGVR